MEPRVSKRDRKLHLNYELPHRIHCSQVYPTLAPNGSTVIIYGHPTGVRVLWRGGRRPRARKTSPQTNGIPKDQDIVVADDSDDEPKASQKQAGDQTGDYEDEEDEQDPDCSYPNIIHDMSIDLGSAALHLAIPTMPPSQPPRLTKTCAIVAVACANGANTLLSIQLAPLDNDGDAPSGVSRVDLPSLSQPARALTAKVLPTDGYEHLQSRPKGRGASLEAEVLVAAVSSALHIWAVDMTASAIKKRRIPLVNTVTLGSPVLSIAFHPSSRSMQLLLSHAAGAVRIYDPYALESPEGQLMGKWIMSYSTPYQSLPASGSSPPHRTRVLSCGWVLHGRGALALLEDGEWGVWDLTLVQPGKDVEDFAISGYVGTAGGESAEPARAKKPSKLAPMTPNTRKAKSENLFSGSSRPSGAAPTGGICVKSNHSESGQTDESVMMWYRNDVYWITSMQQFWQRSIGGGGNSGSLYAPGLTHISGINLMNENITSVSQLPNTTHTSSFGQMNTQRDLVVSAEHRLVISQTIRSSTPTRQLFEQAAQRPVSRDRDRDQRMLDTGDLDLGGLNRMLEGRTEEPRPRRVGFAH